MRPLGWALVNPEGVFMRRGNLDIQKDTRDICTELKPDTNSEKAAICKPSTEVSEVTKPNKLLILVF